MAVARLTPRASTAPRAAAVIGEASTQIVVLVPILMLLVLLVVPGRGLVPRRERRQTPRRTAGCRPGRPTARHGVGTKSAAS